MNTIGTNFRNIIFKNLIWMFFPLVATAQSVGINTATPNPDAVLDIYGPTKGFLPARVALVATNTPLPLSAHVQGMAVYNTANSAVATPVSVYEGLYYSDGVQWNIMGPNTLGLGDIKNSLETADHKGWYLLNGRNKSTLPVIAQYNATAVGIGLVLPNSDDKFIKTTNGSEVMQATGGTNTLTLSQSNLPNVSYSTPTTTDGNHSHGYMDSHNKIKTLGLATNVLALVPLISELVGTNDTLPGTLFATTNSGSHSHSVTVPSGGLGQAINATPSHLVTHVFIYLGE